MARAVKVDFWRIIELVQFDFDCPSCEGLNNSGLTAEDISIGDTRVRCKHCETDFFVDIYDLQNQIVNE